MVPCMCHTGMGIADIQDYVRLCQHGDHTVNTRLTIFIEQKQQLLKQLANI